MDSIAQALTQYELGVIWRLVVWACIAYMLILGALTFIHPVVVNRYCEGFTTSHQVNFYSGLRLIAGLAFIAESPEARFPVLIFWFGTVLAVTAIPMMLLHRRHKHQMAWAIRYAKRLLPVMGAVAIAFGVWLMWAMF